MSPLGNATAEDCANYTIAMFSDLTKRVTLQNLFNDGGFSNLVVRDQVIDTFTKQEFHQYYFLNHLDESWGGFFD